MRRSQAVKMCFAKSRYTAADQKEWGPKLETLFSQGHTKKYFFGFTEMTNGKTLTIAHCPQKPTEKMLEYNFKNWCQIEAAVHIHSVSHHQ